MTFETLVAEIKAFTPLQWVMVLAVALVFGLGLDGLFGGVIGAVVGIILVFALKRGRNGRLS